MSAKDWIRDVDIDRPSPARMYDYFLGGSHNFAADRHAAEQVIAAIPNVREIARANRGFLGRAVRHLVELGVHQFLDIGSGIPTVGNVHEIAQSAQPQARVVYVDIDPVAVAHSVQLLEGNDRTAALRADLRDPEAILAHAAVRSTLDFAEPIGVLLVSMLQFLTDEEAYPAVQHLRDAVAPGSGLVISHVAPEGLPQYRSDAAARVYRRSTSPTGTMRSRADMERFFAGFELVDPGLVWVSQWRPGELAEVGGQPEHIAIMAGVGRKI